MAKNIYMIAPFDVLTGNLGSKQDLRYKLHDNKAYEAPDGVAGAKNYRTRYIGVRRADGSVYFAVKTKSTSNLNAVTRKNMALTGAIAIIISRLMTTQSATWTQINNAFNYLKSNGLLPEGAKTFRKWVDLNLRNMLKFYQTDWSFTQASISFTVANPYCVNAGDSTPVLMPRASFVKFAQPLIFNDDASSHGGIYFKIDGITFIAPFKSAQAPSSFAEILALDGTNIVNALMGITADGSGNILYIGAQVYTSAGVAVKGTDIVAGANYTTTAPTA